MFIGELTLGDGLADSSLDRDYAAIQAVVFQHFEKQFLLRGYRRTAIDFGNARTEVDPYSQCLMRRRRRDPLCREEDQPRPSPQPPIQFVSLARYAGGAPGREAVLTYIVEAKNTWRVALEDASAPSEPTTAKR